MAAPPLSLAKSLVYWSAESRFADRLLTQMDREPESRTHGSFDREHWGWKFRDFPLGMMQTAVYPLALLWKLPLPRNVFFGNPRLERWIYESVDVTLSRQHANGSFDGFCPNEQEAGVGLGVMHGLSEALAILGDRVPRDLESRFSVALDRACHFALNRDERHGIISNHLALFAVVFHTASLRLRNSAYQHKSEQLISAILKHQSPDGWFSEYGGADPGYETLGLFHLAVYWRRTQSVELLEAMRRSVEFLSYCVHPDGSVGGSYGRRRTQLFFPAGLEILGPEVPRAAAIAAFMRQRLARGNVLTPAVADPENLIPLAYNYLEACTTTDVAPSTSLPCQSLDGLRVFADSGIVAGGFGRGYAVVNTGRGAVCRIFDRRNEEIQYEDSGYVARSGGAVYASPEGGDGDPPVVTADTLTVRTGLRGIPQQVPSPWNFLLLRIANLTIFRSPYLAQLVRVRIIRALMASTSESPVRVTRSFRFGTSEIVIKDKIERTGPDPIERLLLPRTFTSIHMGSAKYFHRSELVPVPAADMEQALEDLNRTGSAEIDLRIEWPAAESTRSRENRSS